jgi:hypothetical protein
MKLQMGLLLILAFILFGCAPAYVHHAYDKSYKLNEVRTAYVGEPVIKVSDSYCFTKQTPKFASPSENFTLLAKYKIYGMMQEKSDIKAIKNKNYPIEYSFNDEGIDYHAVFIPDSNGKNSYGVMVDNNGIISSKKYCIMGRFINSIEDTKISPDNIIFTFNGKKTCEFPYKGGQNFELLYSGVNDVTMNITYREFTADDYAKPAFYQNLSYQTTAKQIRFKDFKIDVIEVNNEKLVYKVNSDNLVDTEFIPGQAER